MSGRQKPSEEEEVKVKPDDVSGMTEKKTTMSYRGVARLNYNKLPLCDFGVFLNHQRRLITVFIIGVSELLN